MSIKQTTNRALLLSTACAAVLGFSGGIAVAQEVTEDGAYEGRDVVIVTARKREENLQDVPISITAINQNELRDANAFGLEDIAQLTPGLQFRQIGGVSEPVIRGLAQVDQIGLQGNVGTFIDGIFLNNRSSIEFGNLDLGQVEVLKGPQSALFGRNTFAGAINYTTRSATLGEFDATIEGEAGSHERLGIKGSVNIPLGEFAAVRAFGGTSKFDGTIDNLQDEDNVGGWDERTTYGASALFELDRVRIKGFYARNEVQEDQPALRLITADDNNAGTTYVNDLDPNDTQSTLFAGTVPNFQNVDLFPGGTGNVGHFWLAYGTVDIDLGFGTATGTYSRSESEYASQFDNTGNAINVTQPLFFNPAAAPLSNQILTNSTGDVATQDSYEFRLASNERSPFGWLIGYSHFDSVTGGVLSSVVPNIGDTSGAVTPITFITNRLDVNIDAIYGSFNIPVTDRLNIGGEVRYTDEEQIQINETDINIPPTFVSDGDPVASPANFEFWSGRATLDYALNDDVLLYGYAARGVKSGGVNPGQPDTSDFRFFEPETNWTYELGFKATLWDGRAVVNTAIYLIDWSDLQTPAPPTISTAGPIINGIGATSKGIEVDATVRVTENFTLRVASSYIDATYDDGFQDAAIANYCGAAAPAGFSIQGTPCSLDVSGNQIARAGDFTAFVSGTYEIPDIAYGFDGYLRADFSHEAAPYPTSLNIAQPDDRNFLNLRFGIRNENTELAFWADNVLNTDNIERVTLIPDFFRSGSFGCTVNNCLGSLRVYPGNTRTWGVKVVQRF